MLTEHPDVKMFVCPDCDLTMKSQVILELHQEIVHKSQLSQVEKIENLMWPCPICRRNFKVYHRSGQRKDGIWYHVESA